MKKILILIPAMFLFVGCDWFSVSNDTIDTGFINPQTECPTCPEPEPCSSDNDRIYGQLSDITSQIDVSNVRLNHYVDEEKIEENLADIFDINGSIVTQNVITMPPYAGQRIKHIIVVEFYQIH